MMFIITWNASSGKHDLAGLASNSAPATYVFGVRVNRQIHIDIYAEKQRTLKLPEMMCSPVEVIF